MGITYEELGVFGRLRKISRCGPVATFHAAVRLWHASVPVATIAERVKFFFRCDIPCGIAASSQYLASMLHRCNACRKHGTACTNARPQV
jgi:hypothetical protein